MTYQKILEMRGWKGLAFPTVHARDLKLFLEVRPLLLSSLTLR